MTRKIIIIATAALFLLTALVPAFAADSDRQLIMEQIVSKVLNIPTKDVDNYQNQTIGLGELVAASVIAEKTDLTLKQVLDLHESGKAFGEIVSGKNVSLKDYQQALDAVNKKIINEEVKAGLINKETAERKIKLVDEKGQWAAKHGEMEKVLAKVLNLSSGDLTNYHKQGITMKQLVPAYVIAQKSKTSLQKILDEHKDGKNFQQIAKAHNISSQNFHQGVLDLRKTVMKEGVKAGVITAEQEKKLTKNFGKQGKFKANKHKCQKAKKSKKNLVF